MTSLEITLPMRGEPKTRSVALPSIGHKELDALSELSHGGFKLNQPRLQYVPADAVNPILKSMFKNGIKLIKGSVSPDLFLLLLSRQMYNARLKEAYEVAQRNDLGFLTAKYETLYREKMKDTLEKIESETGVRVSQGQHSLKTMGAFPLRRAWTLFQRNQSTLQQIAGTDVETQRPPAELEHEEPTYTATPKGLRDVYVTFDDGPGTQTPHLIGMLNALEQLHRKSLPVTFFVTGNSMEGLENGKQIVLRAHQAGHGIGSHTRTHQYNLSGWPSRQVLHEEITHPKQELEQLLGVPVEHFRFPGGIFSWPALLHVRSQGMDHVDWSVDTGDYHLAQQVALESRTQDKEALLEAARKELLKQVARARAGDVILMHDGEVLQPVKIADLPVIWTHETAKNNDAASRRARSEARGNFVTSTIDSVVQTLHQNNLQLAHLPKDPRQYSKRYSKRLALKKMQAVPGVRTAIAASRSAIRAAGRAIRMGGDIL